MTEELLTQLATDPKAVLNRGFKAMERIEWRQEKINKLKAIAVSITANPENSSSGPKGFVESKTERIMTAVVDMEDAIAAEILEITTFEQEAKEIIDAFVEKPTHKVILEMRYRSQYSWSEIANRLHYTDNWVQRLHQQALISLEENVKKRINH